MKLQKNHELRFEGKNMKITVTKGHCEHKGMELMLNRPYTFKNCNSFIFAHEDSELVLEDDCEKYTSTNSNTSEILNFFSKILEEDNKTFLVLGKGKCTFVQTISNYLLRYDKSVLITELNPSTGFITFPGCVSSVLNTNLIDTNGVELDNPLVYFYGSSNVNSNLDFFKNILQKINQAIVKKEFDFHFIIIDEEIMEILNEIKLDAFTGTYVVLKEEKLYNKIKEKKILISGGTYEETDKFNKINNYFYGNTGVITSFSVKLNKSKCKIVRIGEEFVAPDTALPIGADRIIKRDIVVEVEPRVGAVLGASYANNDEEVCETPVKSFVVVDSVHEKFIKVLSPQPNLKCNYLLQGEIDNKFAE
ncbi:Cleavage polyadenylation factor subunit clp1 [Conglomerata obtusa]